MITRIEVRGHPQTATPLQQATDFLCYLTEMLRSEAIVQRTMTLRQRHRIRLPEALTAATALALDEPLVTRNTQDFQAIAGLVRLNPFTEGA